jgi:hypothetical protein
MTHSSGAAPFVWDVALFFHVPSPVTEQALIDVHAVVCDMPILAAPETVHIILVRAMLPPIREVVEPCIEHGLGDVQGHQGIVKDAWLEAAEGIGTGQGV